MVGFHAMRTTIDIRDPLLERAKQLAAGQGKLLADIVNDALAEKLAREVQAKASVQPFKMLTFGQGGPRPGVDLNSNAHLQEILDDDSRDSVTGQLDLDTLR
jgi:hypothetical protein